MVDIENWNCLVAGGGKTALHKVKKLLPFGVNLCVVAPRVCRELLELSRVNEEEQVHNLRLICRAFQDDDICGMDMVIAATDDESLNYHIFELCKQKRLPVNVVDRKDACSFIFPAMIQQRDMLVSVSTGGESPAGAAYVKRRIQEQLPGYYGDMIAALGQYRETVFAHVDAAQKRKEVFERLLSYGDAHDGEIPETVLDAVIAEVLSEE
jgi:siroheme synthase-like protein